MSWMLLRKHHECNEEIRNHHPFVCEDVMKSRGRVYSDNWTRGGFGPKASVLFLPRLSLLV